MQGEEVEGVGVGSGLGKRQQRGDDGAHHDHARERGPASGKKKKERKKCSHTGKKNLNDNLTVDPDVRLNYLGLPQGC